MHFGLFLARLAMAVTDHTGRSRTFSRLSDEIAGHACGVWGATSFATLIFFATMSLNPIPMRPTTT